MPEFWPKDPKGNFVKEVFRSMRSDFADLQYEYHPSMALRSDSKEMRETVVHAVAHGSKYRSPFLHTSTSLFCARRWARMSTNLRGENESLFCCINIYDMLCDGSLQPGDVIDLSNHTALKAYFRGKPGDYGEFVEEHFQECCTFAQKSKEVIIKWRGTLKLEHLYVFDDITQVNHGPLPEWVPADLLPGLLPRQPSSPPPATESSPPIPPWRQNPNEAADKIPDLPPVPPWRKKKDEADKHEAAMPVDAGGSRQMKAESTQAEEDADADKSSLFLASFPSVHSEHEVDWGDENPDETIEARSESDADVPQEYPVHPAFDSVATQIRSKREESVETRHLLTLRSLETAEKTYTWELRTLQQGFVSESQRDITVHGHRHLCIGGGFSRERQKGRHDLKRSLAWGDPRAKYAEEEVSATKRHKARLSQIAEQFERDFPGDTFLSDMPLNPHSRDCLQEVRDEPRLSANEVNYTQIFQRKGLITLPWNFRGRKAGTIALEVALTESEEDVCYDWCQWWLDIGAFRSISDFDANGWSAVHHAVDSMTFSARAEHAARVLAMCTPVSVLDAKTTGTRPAGFTVLHLLCDGSDVNFSKASVVELLLARKVDMEAKDPKGNTALLMAAATGLTDVCDVLLDSGADKDVYNDNGHGVWQKGYDCSKTFGKHLLKRGCPKWWSYNSGRTREGDGQGRMCRHAMTTSANSLYTSNSVAKSFGKGRKGKP